MVAKLPHNGSRTQVLTIGSYISLNLKTHSNLVQTVFIQLIYAIKNIDSNHSNDAMM